MSTIRFGVSQISETTPILYTRIQAAVSTILLPSVTAFIMSVEPAAKQPLLIACVVFAGALISAIGVCLGASPVTPVVPPTPISASKN